MLSWAHAFGLPLLADPLSGLRRFDDGAVIDSYDAVLEHGGAAPEELMPRVIVRFGRYPISKKATQFAAAACAAGATQLVVDALETRDFNAATDRFVRATPVAFARAAMDAAAHGTAPVSAASDASPVACAAAQSEGALDASASNGVSSSAAVIPPEQARFLSAWQEAAAAARARIARVDAAADDAFEGAYVRRALALAPAGSCLFAANSMAVRAVDTFLVHGTALTVLANRGLNGIDGTVSSAIGAAHAFAQTTLITGDLTLQHDLNALALQRELLRRARRGEQAPSVVIVLLNNNGGGIFDMLPQRSDEDYFERLFLTPQDIDFGAAARAFNVPYSLVENVQAFKDAYRGCLDVPGISLIEVRVPLRGLPERYAPYWSAR